MRVLLINPPYQTLTSNFGVGHQVPLGLLMVGGPLIDSGHEVRLLDAECRRLSVRSVVRAVRTFRPEVVMTGHAGSTPAHPVCVRMLRAIKAECPSVLTVYGGVYPTYHAAGIIDAEPAVDVVVRGEGEAAPAEVLRAVESAPAQLDELPGVAFPSPGNVRTQATLITKLTERVAATFIRAGESPGGRLDDVPGIAFRRAGRAVTTPDRPPLRDLDAPRTAWELIERWDDYRCFGMGRAAIVQFSRGCPHRCTYCGQHGFWVRWRHRDPGRLVDEVERLHREHGVRFITLADENPTTLRPVWERLLTELAARRLPVRFFATIRATDIVRDADLLPLYREAGILYVLMGIESTREDVLRRVRKGSTPRHDLEACRLLKQNGIFSILGHIVGLGDESWPTFRAARRALVEYDGDYLNAMYVTPHDWTPFGRAALDREIVESDPRRWDYRHQVLAEARLRPWQLLLAVKWLEICFHLRPRRVWSILRERNRFRRRQLLWCSLHTGLVWLAELAEFAIRAAGRAATWPCRWRRNKAKLQTERHQTRRLPLAVLDGTLPAS